MARSSRRIAVLPDDDDDRSGFPRRRSGRALPFAVAAGLLIGVLALFFAYRELRDAGDDGAPAVLPVTAADTNAEDALKIVFPEGFSRRDMADRVVAVNRIARSKGRDSALTASTYLRAAQDVSLLPEGFLARRQQNRVKHLEGFLFPATYEFLETTSSKELVQKQLDAFFENWKKLKLADGVRPKKLTPYEILVVASIIEKEVKAPKERRLVAAVIYNRLERGMPLGVDATLRYGLKIPADEAITASQLASDDPYNTSKVPGLPPTPIANPGLPSLEAAVHPADVEHLYFVRKKDCRTHYFTDSAADFEAFIDGPDSFLNGPDSCP